MGPGETNQAEYDFSKKKKRRLTLSGNKYVMENSEPSSSTQILSLVIKRLISTIDISISDLPSLTPYMIQISRVLIYLSN